MAPPNAATHSTRFQPACSRRTRTSTCSPPAETDQESSGAAVALADQVGRLRQKIENEGFNVQKNSGLNLEHVFSQQWDHAKAYYYFCETDFDVELARRCHIALDSS